MRSKKPHHFSIDDSKITHHFLAIFVLWWVKKDSTVYIIQVLNFVFPTSKLSFRPTLIKLATIISSSSLQDLTLENVPVFIMAITSDCESATNS